MKFLLLVLVAGIALMGGCVKEAPPEGEEAAAPTPGSPAPEAAPTPVPTPALPEFEWTKDPGTRVSDGGVPYAHRLKDGRLRLYYCGEGGILSAVSGDGINFEKEPGVRIAPAGSLGDAEAMVCDATVVELEGGRVRMYYKGANGQGGPGQAVHKVFSAVSMDGLSFQKEGVRIDSEKTGDRGWASVPEAVKLPEGGVRIYYVSGDLEAMGGTMSAVSMDGLNFQKERGARVKTLVDPAVIILPDGTYLMLAVVLPPPPEAMQKSTVPLGIYSLTSQDGLTFGNRQPVLLERGVYDPSIVRLDEDTYRVFYGKDTGEEGMRMVTRSLTGRLK